MNRTSAIAKTLAALSLLPLLCAFGGSDKTSTERRDANRFILEKLNRQAGDGWQRSGQFFLWSYRFSKDGCELTISREAVDGGELVRQIVPIADVVPVWQGGPSVGLYCQATTDCIELETKGGDHDDSKQIGDTAVLAPQPDDLPKLADAFGELHRLCDDAYGR
ncbi:MAG: hypothetical protein JWQ90_4827 [Hydrocarboniphaga sp.]|uniref:hypothetical protein n=1 Tax=Hydrocarboniphaga sp. TaxID=2033016 RepID=UPI002632E61E|nr:hypothetical protein [Hydrocarboniphaga sp.]MDB5972377.1 hypothetical protein [Hydrocarboniphaga sp.]